MIIQGEFSSYFNNKSMGKKQEHLVVDIKTYKRYEKRRRGGVGMKWLVMLSRMNFFSKEHVGFF